MDIIEKIEALPGGKPMWYPADDSVAVEPCDFTASDLKALAARVAELEVAEKALDDLLVATLDYHAEHLGINTTPAARYVSLKEAIVRAQQALAEIRSADQAPSGS